MRNRFIAAVAGVVLLPPLWIAASIVFPGLLFFPYHQRVGETPVYAESPIGPHIIDDVVRSNELLRASSLYRPAVLSHPIYLTSGGWRWRILSFDSGHAFGQTRPLSGRVVLNRSDVASDRIWNGLAVAGERRLSDVMAHERTHILITLRFGLFSTRYPSWVREGYCDYVARSSSLSDETATALIADGRRVPALAYYRARQQVAAELRANGGSVPALFQAALSGAIPAPRP